MKLKKVKINFKKINKKNFQKNKTRKKQNKNKNLIFIQKNLLIQVGLLIQKKLN